MLKKLSCFLIDVKKLVKISNSSQRAVSEIIGAMLLLGITVAGGVLVWGLIQGNEVLNYAEEDQELNPQVINKLKIIGYDTRDDDSLYNIPAIGNDNDACNPCALNDANYIIIKIRNDNTNDVEIKSILINEVTHSFDSDHTTPGQSFSASTLPESGEFIIISANGVSGLLQEPTSIISKGSDKRIVLRLASDFASPNAIALNSKIRTVINSSAETTKEYLIPAGALA